MCRIPEAYEAASSFLFMLDVCFFDGERGRHRWCLRTTGNVQRCRFRTRQSISQSTGTLTKMLNENTSIMTYLLFKRSPKVYMMIAKTANHYQNQLCSSLQTHASGISPWRFEIISHHKSVWVTTMSFHCLKNPDSELGVKPTKRNISHMDKRMLFSWPTHFHRPEVRKLLLFYFYFFSTWS